MTTVKGIMTDAYYDEIMIISVIYRLVNTLNNPLFLILKLVI
jgi:hypothetical protein